MKAHSFSSQWTPSRRNAFASRNRVFRRRFSFSLRGLQWCKVAKAGSIVPEPAEWVNTAISCACCTERSLRRALSRPAAVILEAFHCEGIRSAEVTSRVRRRRRLFSRRSIFSSCGWCRCWRCPRRGLVGEPSIEGSVCEEERAKSG